VATATWWNGIPALLVAARSAEWPEAYRAGHATAPAAAAFSRGRGPPIHAGSMALDVLALVLLATFAWLGARRGALATGLSLGGLVAAYAAAVLAARHLGTAVGDALGVSPWVGAPVAGVVAFALVSFDVALVSWILRRRRDAAPTPASRAGGAVFGALRGALVVLLIGVGALWLDAWRALGAHHDADRVAVDTPLRHVARSAVETGVAAALGEGTPAAELAARTLARPAESLAQLRALTEAPEVIALAEDGAFWAYVEAGEVSAALAQPSFQRLQWNGERRRQLAALGLVDELAAGDPALFALALRGVLEELGPRLRALREDPDLAALARDPAVAALVERRDVVGLLGHPGLQRVLARALTGEPGRG
jgi:membrane protein required for colicin V production